MEKKGQVTIFAIIGIIIVIIFVLALMLQDKGTKPSAHRDDNDLNKVKVYGESCLKDATEMAVYKLGLEGGHINPRGDSFYDISGIPHYDFKGESLPIFLDENGVRSIPDKQDVEENLEKIIEVNFFDCFDLTTFKSMGMEIEAPLTNYENGYQEYEDVNADVTVFDDRIDVKLNYPIEISNLDKVKKVDEFRHSSSIRLGRILEGLNSLLPKIKEKWDQHTIRDNNFYLEDFNCDQIDPKKYITIYALDNDNLNKRVVRVVDYYNFYKTDHKSGFIFQFAVEDTKEEPIRFRGIVCQGTPLNI